MSDNFLTVSEAAASLGKSERTILRYLNADPPKLKGEMIDGAWNVYADSVRTLTDSGKVSLSLTSLRDEDQGADRMPTPAESMPTPADTLIEELRGRLGDKEGEMERLLTERQSLQTEVSGLREQLAAEHEEHKTELKLLREELAQKDTQIAELTRQVVQLVQRAQQGEAELRRLLLWQQQPFWRRWLGRPSKVILLPPPPKEEGNEEKEG